MKTAEQWKADLKLDELPGEELLALLNETAGQEAAAVPPEVSHAASLVSELNVDTLEGEVEALHTARTIGAALAAMRGARHLGVREMGRKLGTTGSAVTRLERGENAEIATVVRYAEAAGYRVRILLEPEDEGPTITTAL